LVEGYQHLPFYPTTRRRIPKITVLIPFTVRAPSPGRPLIILHPLSATVTTGFTPFGASTFRISKGEFITTGHYRLCQYKVLRAERHCVCFLELSPVRDPTSAPRVVDGRTRGAAEDSK